MECIYCNSKIDVINQIKDGCISGVIPEAIISENKLIRNKKNLLVCMNCINHHNKAVEKHM